METPGPRSSAAPPRPTTRSHDYIHRDGQLLATARVAGAGETRHHFHLDHLGTPLQITTPQGGNEMLHSKQISREMLNKAQTDNANFLALKELANSEAVVEFFTAPTFLDADGMGGDFSYSSVDSLIAEWGPKLGLEEARRLLDRPELFLGGFNPPETSCTDNGGSVSLSTINCPILGW